VEHRCQSLCSVEKLFLAHSHKLLKSRTHLCKTSIYQWQIPLPAFPVSGKVWSILITTQQEGFTPKAPLAWLFTAQVLWYFTLRVYSPCANILGLRVLSVNGTTELQNQWSDTLTFFNCHFILSLLLLRSNRRGHGVHGYVKWLTGCRLSGNRLLRKWSLFVEICIH